MTRGTKKLALAVEYPLMQQGGTEVLVQELIRRLAPHYQIVLISGDRAVSELPVEFSRLILSHLAWQPQTATRDSARSLAQAIKQQVVEIAHFHFGGTYEWRSNRFWRCPVLHIAGAAVPC